MDYQDESTCAKRTARIRTLNDQLRVQGLGGRTVATRAMAALPPGALAEILAAVRQFDAFTASNDPYGERDFGSVTVDGDAYFWKIDYYDIDLNFGSPDPADPTVTRRVLTFMAAGDL